MYGLLQLTSKLLPHRTEVLPWHPQRGLARVKSRSRRACASDWASTPVIGSSSSNRSRAFSSSRPPATSDPSRGLELPLSDRTGCGLLIAADELARRFQPQGFMRMNLVVILEPVRQM